MDETTKLSSPWGGSTDQTASHAFAGRPCLETAGVVKRVVVTQLSEELPLLATWKDKSGDIWKKFELPSTGTESSEGSATENLQLSLQRKASNPQQFCILLDEGIPRQKRQDIEEDDEEPLKDNWQIISLETTELIDKHIDLVNRLYDKKKVLQGYWHGHTNGLAFCRLSLVLNAWRDIGRRDDPRMALIVRLERDQSFRRLLSDVCSRPRLVLTRRREMQPLSRIQEIDPACIRWIVRQPGITLAQKAGTRQEALGVVRVENADTPENRVIKDLVRRAIQACNRYLAENRYFREHERVRRVRRFRRELREYFLHSSISNVRSLVGVARPNYVLQHDQRYNPLWHKYLLLVKQEMQQDEAWRWRQRIWAEHLGFALMAGLSGIPDAVQPDSSDILIRPEQVSGKYLDPCSVTAHWSITAGRESEAIDFVTGTQMRKHPMIPSRLNQLCPDFVLVRRTYLKPKLISILAVWTVLDFDLSRDRLAERTRSISESLKNFSATHQIAGLLVQPSLPPTTELIRNKKVGEKSCAGTRLSVNLQSELPELESLIMSGLRIPRNE